jgi:hypothetical protein
MSDAPVTTPDAKPSAEWKPEPRQWSWRDLFTAPMLAFKPKCMLIAAVTLVVMGLWWKLFDVYRSDIYNTPAQVTAIIDWFQTTIALVIFSLGASLIAVFMKADLLDDEFLSFKEAFAQFKTRVGAAVLVPVFLMLLLGGVNLLMVWVPLLIAGIPYAGPTIYALLYPLGFLAGLFVVLLGIAVWLSIFVFPSIIAIRRHGWFDNVVDTVEAVGTKPHLLLGSLLVSLLMMFLAHRIGFAGMDHLKDQLRTQPDLGIGWANNVRQAEDHADLMLNDAQDAFSTLIVRNADTLHLRSLIDGVSLFPRRSPFIVLNTDSYAYTYPGFVVGLWQVGIAALIAGYVFNLFVAGGMLTYLVVREDDYWDDEDLEDLDQLAKELEDEAKREQAADAGQPAAGDAKPAG